MSNHQHYWEVAPTTYEQLTPQKWRSHGTLLWIIIMLLVALISIIPKIVNGAITLLPASISLSMITILLPLIFSLVRNQIIDLAEELNTFTTLPLKEIQNATRTTAHNIITGSWLKWVCGLLVLGAGIFTQFSLNNPYNNPVIRITSLIGSSTLLFFSGTAVYSVLNSIFNASQMERLPIHLPVYQDKTTGITAINPIIFRYSVIMLIFYALLLTGVVFGAYSFGIGLLIWLTIGGLLIAIAPMAALWGFHTVMRKAKREILTELAPHIENAVKDSVKRPTKDNLDYIHALFSLKRELEQLPEWPIDFKTIFTLFTTAMLPIIALALDILTR